MLDRLGEDDFFERDEVRDGLKREVASLWASDEIRRFKPTPVVEAQSGLAVLESVLWYAIPNYLRKLDAEMRRQLGEDMGLPLECAPLTFASWMGGDRDGNPNVRPETTATVIALQRELASELYLRDVQDLYEELSMSTGFSEEVLAHAASITDEDLFLDESELYRRVLAKAAKELRADNGQGEGAAALMGPLRMIHDSLVRSGRREIANGRLTDVIRRVAAFGSSLLPLDVRQESTRHTEALDAVTKHLGIGSYAEWSEETRIQWLCQELGNKRPLLPHGASVDFPGSEAGAVKDTLETFLMMSRQPRGALGAYVISQAKAASDVLAVALLQQEFGLRQRVVPLFETLDDLDNAPDIVQRLFQLPAYVGRINGAQEIMVGYSDSAKDAGRLAACWAQYRCQERLVEVGEQHKVQLTFFHGKGGTVGRGGNPAVYRAVLAHPPKTIAGRFRVTEQGEMIGQNFGHEAVAQRTLDVYTAAVLREKHQARQALPQQWRDTMDVLARDTCAYYRDTVRNNEDFVGYFRKVTPEQELAELNIGSRPAKRNPKGGVESLRAIPWQFAWAQTRSNLPAWLGLQQLSPQQQLEAQQMYRDWPWFREIVDLIAMILVKAEPRIAHNYDFQLLDDDGDEKLQALGDDIAKKMKETRSTILSISQQENLYMGNEVLERELRVRNPYIDCLNVVQANLLKRIRKRAADKLEPDQYEKDALLVTINGIAAGIRNSG